VALQFRVVMSNATVDGTRKVQSKDPRQLVNYEFCCI